MLVTVTTRRMSVKAKAYYDLYDDWDLIEASIAQQYGVRLRKEINTIKWSEVRVMIAGLTSETPLGKIISIRTETDPDIIKNFSPDMRRIRNEWVNKLAQERLKDTESLDRDFKAMEDALARMFSE